MSRARILPEGQSASSVLVDLKTEIAALERLDLDLLRRRWRSLLGRSAPAHLPRNLLVRMLAYQHQIAQLGDLDRDTRTALAQGGGAQSDKPHLDLAFDASKRRGSARIKSAALRVGTVLEREYGGVLHRVTVMKDGCAWNGQEYRSLSEAAQAITGTKWNGPRFFGLRVNAKALAFSAAGGTPLTKDSAAETAS